MRAAAIRALLFVALALGGLSSGAAMAGVQLDPIGTVTSAISTIASQTTVVSDLTGSVTSATSGGSGSGATDLVSGSGVLSGSGTTDSNSSGADGGSGSASSGDASPGSATASNPRSPHTRFDRLPRRYENLLEQIESGRHVRANIARLRALLASASPQLRARVMRLIRLEIRRLERGGLTRRERAADRRLRGLLTTLQGQGAQPVTQGPLSLARLDRLGVLSATTGGVEAPTAGSESRGRPPTSARDGAGNAIPRLPLALPPPPSGPSYLALLLLILAALACLLLLLTGSPRHPR